MKTVRYFSLFAGAGLLAGCIGLDVDRLGNTEATGDAFTTALTDEYRALANFEAFQMEDWRDADRFARKGLAAAAGEYVAPEELSDWNVPADSVDELAQARADLLGAFAAGARENQPQEAALAQAKFDCWIEQQEENFQQDHIAACRDEFFAALRVIQAPPIEDLPAVFFVFFDFDSSVITDGAQQNIDEIVAAHAELGFPVIDVVGYTDTSGSAAYNQALSVRRANSVEAALGNSGVDPALVETSGNGENDLLVQTPDGVREPSNRRAEIRFQ